MTDRVEGSCEVEQQENADMACISSNEKVVYDLDQCRPVPISYGESDVVEFVRRQYAQGVWL